eukprot:TRINITY_DN2597_c3_g1_i1.p1 TRINITY_DN2597_c3_g1~~TRINITY_DN2597_c3_g1_i1.p1  ORF type:complete len:271 (+),score=38.26 TRINITY_DN2597_c3_g1_i1:72-884(+)
MDGTAPPPPPQGWPQPGPQPGQPPRYQPPPPQLMMVPSLMAGLPIPSETLWARGSLRMTLVYTWPRAVGYRMTPTEASEASVWRLRRYLQIAVDIIVPISIWRRLSPLPEGAMQATMPESGSLISGAAGRNLPLPARISATCMAVFCCLAWGWWTAEAQFQRITQHQSPLGAYARWVAEQGRVAAAQGVKWIPHPPVMPPQFQWGAPPQQWPGQPPQQPPASLQQQQQQHWAQAPPPAAPGQGRPESAERENSTSFSFEAEAGSAEHQRQ